MKQNKEFLKLLIDKDLSKKELSRKVGVSWQTVYYWSIGRNKPSVFAIIKMSEIFEISAEELYELFIKRKKTNSVAAHKQK